MSSISFRAPANVTLPAAQKTLADLMRSAAGKSRRLSSPKSTADMRKVVLQNRMVKVVNIALAENPLSTTVHRLDSAFISASKQQPQPRHSFQFSPMAAEFIPSTSSSEQFFLPSTHSEEIDDFLLQRQPSTEPEY
jgi:hypothetical protein